jgi:hypothetical protein
MITLYCDFGVAMASPQQQQQGGGAATTSNKERTTKAEVGGKDMSVCVFQFSVSHDTR